MRRAELALPLLKKLTYPTPAKDAFFSALQLEESTYNPYIHYRDVQIRIKAARSMKDTLAAHNGDEILAAYQLVRKNKEIGAVIIENFPAESLKELGNPPRELIFDPHNKRSFGKKGFKAEYGLLAFNMLCGLRIRTYPSLQGGFFAQQVCIKNGKRNTASHAGAADFPLHMDSAHSPREEMVDVVSLLALRNFATKSLIVPVRPLEQALREGLGENFNVITTPSFIIYTSPAYGELHTLRAPLAYQDESGAIVKWRIQGNKDLIRPDPDNEHAKKALEIIFNFLERPPIQHEFVLKPGNLLFFDNSEYLHARQPIKWPVDGRRLLLRTHGIFCDKINQELATAGIVDTSAVADNCDTADTQQGYKR